MTAFTPTVPAPSCDRRDFIETMARAATGVGIVTTDGPAGRFGLTVNSMASVSADPPMVLACVRAASPAAAAIRANAAFGLNLLEAGSVETADCFAGRAGRTEAFDFACAEWETAGGPAPLLKGALAAFSCRLEHAVEAGSHLIFIGLVLATRQSGGPALLYVDRRYGKPA